MRNLIKIENYLAIEPKITTRCRWMPSYFSRIWIGKSNNYVKYFQNCVIQYLFDLQKFACET